MFWKKTLIHLRKKAHFNKYEEAQAKKKERGHTSFG